MKAYVDEYRPKKKTIDGKTYDSYPQHEVLLHREPRRKMDRAKAESECTTMLNLARFRFGDHVCNFTVEELQSGEFVIVCLNHPDEGPGAS